MNRPPLEARASVEDVLAEVRDVHSSQHDALSLELAVTRAALRDERAAHETTSGELMRVRAELAALTDGAQPPGGEGG